MGPVWAYWAYVMERYCGLLKPALSSRRFVFAAIDRFIVDHAQLMQIALIYNLAEELSLEQPCKPVAGTFSNDACMYFHCSWSVATLNTLLDPDIILLPPSSTPLPEVNTGICAALATMSGLTIAAVRHYVKDATVQRWGKVRRVDSEEGDTMRASSFVRSIDDTRDATFVRVCLLSFLLAFPM